MGVDIWGLWLKRQGPLCSLMLKGGSLVTFGHSLGVINTDCFLLRISNCQSQCRKKPTVQYRVGFSAALHSFALGCCYAYKQNGGSFTVVALSKLNRKVYIPVVTY